MGIWNNGAEGGTRTPTGVSPHEPESCASTNSATSAGKRNLQEVYTNK